jgi:hypothetical protein
MQVSSRGWLAARAAVDWARTSRVWNRIPVFSIEPGEGELSDDIALVPDYYQSGQRPKMISNPAEVRIKANAALRLSTIARAGQRSSRSSTAVRANAEFPAPRIQQKYPLACCVIDMTDGCGSVMYGHTSGKRALYTCGRYMRTAGAECKNNQVDAEALHRLALSWLRQFAASGTRRSQIVELLKKRAAEAALATPEDVSAGDELARLPKRNGFQGGPPR